MPTCFFIGHREAPETLMGELTAEVERLIIEYGVTDFVVGRYGRFDTLAAKCVKAAKKRRPEVTLTLLLPYHPYDRPTPTPPGFDGTFYPPGMETVPKSLFNISTCMDWRVDFLPCKAKIRRHPDGWQGFLTQSGRKIRRQDMRGEILNRL